MQIEIKEEHLEQSNAVEDLKQDITFYEKITNDDLKTITRIYLMDVTLNDTDFYGSTEASGEMKRFYLSELVSSLSEHNQPIRMKVMLHTTRITMKLIEIISENCSKESFSFIKFVYYNDERLYALDEDIDTGVLDAMIESSNTTAMKLFLKSIIGYHNKVGKLGKFVNNAMNV